MNIVDYTQKSKNLSMSMENLTQKSVNFSMTTEYYTQKSYYLSMNEYWERVSKFSIPNTQYSLKS